MEREPDFEEKAEQKVAALKRERLRQMRGLLLIAAAVLAFLLWRAQPLHLFHAGWWRV